MIILWNAWEWVFHHGLVYNWGGSTSEEMDSFFCSCVSSGITLHCGCKDSFSTKLMPAAWLLSVNLSATIEHKIHPAVLISSQLKNVINVLSPLKSQWEGWTHIDGGTWVISIKSELLPFHSLYFCFNHCLSLPFLFHHHQQVFLLQSRVSHLFSLFNFYPGSRSGRTIPLMVLQWLP